MMAPPVKSGPRYNEMINVPRVRVIDDEGENLGVMLRHQAAAGGEQPELSGHFHPKLRVGVRGRRIARPCLVASERRMILPAFGALTGGMDVTDPAIREAMMPADAVDALVAAGERVVRLPVWRSEAA